MRIGSRMISRALPAECSMSISMSIPRLAGSQIWGRPELEYAVESMSRARWSVDLSADTAPAHTERSFDVDDQLELFRRLQRQLAGVVALQNLIHVGGGAPVQVRQI